MSNLQIVVKDKEIEITNTRIFSTASFIFENNKQRDKFLNKTAINFMIEE